MFGEPPFPTIYTGTTGFKTETISAQSIAFSNSAEIVNVTYDPAGGKFSDDSTTNKVVAALKGTTFTVSETPTWTGHVFAGWKLNDSTTYQVSDTFTVTGDVTLTAQWVEFVTLTVTNTVTGPMGDTEEAFTYTVDGLESGTDYAYTKTNADSTTSTGNLTSTINTFTLKHGEQIEITLPAESAVTVTEEEIVGYTTTVSLNSETPAAGLSRAFTLSADGTLAFVNNRDDISFTGVELRSEPFAAIGAVGLALVLLCGVARRKKRALLLEKGGDAD